MALQQRRPSQVVQGEIEAPLVTVLPADRDGLLVQSRPPLVVAFQEQLVAQAEQEIREPEGVAGLPAQDDALFVDLFSPLGVAHPPRCGRKLEEGLRDQDPVTGPAADQETLFEQLPPPCVISPHPRRSSRHYTQGGGEAVLDLRICAQFHGLSGYCFSAVVVPPVVGQPVQSFQGSYPDYHRSPFVPGKR